MADTGISKNIFVFAASAGAGAAATIASIYLLDRIKNTFARKPKMKLFDKNPFLSTRCTWFISELGAESDFAVKYPDNTSEDFRGSQLSLTYEPADAEESADSVESDMESVAEYNMGPAHSLPAFIVNDEFTMIEGTAMCLYLADLYQQFLPHPEHKAEYYSWMVYSASTFDNIMKTLQHQMVDIPEEKQSIDLIEPAMNGFHAFARALSHTLEDREYLCGDRFTAADCVLGFTMWWAYTFEGGNLLDGYPVLLKYLQRLKGRPAFQKIFGQEESLDWKTSLATGFKALGH